MPGRPAVKVFPVPTVCRDHRGFLVKLDLRGLREGKVLLAPQSSE